jgi:hypothetical protein
MIVAEVIAILQALAAKIDGANEHPLIARGAQAVQSRPVSDYLVTKPRLIQNFNNPAVDPARFAFDYIQTIRPRLADLNANATLVSKLADAPVRRSETLADPEVRPIAGVAKPGITDFLLSINLEASIATAGGGQVAVKQLVDQTVGTSFTLLNRVTDTPQRAADAVIKLRAFDNSLIILLAAEKAAATVGRPLADVMTLYRQEGGYPIFPAFDSVLAGIPSATTTYETHLSAFALPDLTHLIWVGDPTNSALVRRTDPQRVEFAAATCLYVTSQGMDRLGSVFTVNETSPNPQPWPDVFDALANSWWGAGGLISRVPGFATGRQRWARSQALLKFKNPFLTLDGQGPNALLIAPSDPVGFMALILMEGLGFYEAHRHFADERDVIGTAELSTGIKYLRYNSQMNPEHVPGIMLSALASAQVSGRDDYAALKDSIGNDDGIKTLIKSVYESAKTTNTRNIRQALWIAKAREQGLNSQSGDLVLDARLKSWLSNDDNMTLLCKFIETAGSPGDWPNWPEHRSNLSRFRIARRFFERLFDSYVPPVGRALS